MRINYNLNLSAADINVIHYRGTFIIEIAIIQIKAPMASDAIESVSVIIPTYFRNENLKQAIESCIQQDFGSVEIIVVDDSGEEYAQPVVSDYDNVEYIALSEK